MMDQRNPPPGWEWVDQEIGSTYVRTPGGRATPLMQAWNIWLTAELEAAKQRISAVEAWYDRAHAAMGDDAGCELIAILWPENSDDDD